MTDQEKLSFIKTIAPIVQKHAKLNGIKCNSAIIAQAILESAWGQSQLASKHHNYFGLKCGSYWKGASVNYATQEEYTPGTMTNIRDNFRSYSSMECGIAGYFVFIDTKRYKNLKGIANPQIYLENIKADGYATDSKYVDSNMWLVNKYTLTQYDQDLNTNLNLMEIAKEVIDGRWGNGSYRFKKLTDAGYDAKQVQAEVNRQTTHCYLTYRGNSTSIVDSLKEVGCLDTSFTHRFKIATMNNIKPYIGTAKQNQQLLELLKTGKLIKG